MISYYLEIIALSNPSHMMSMADPIAIDVEDTKDREWLLFRERVH